MTTLYFAVTLNLQGISKILLKTFYGQCVVSYGGIFFELKNRFSEKIPVFLIPVHDSRSKDRNSDAPSKVTQVMKITLIVQALDSKGKIQAFFWPGTVSVVPLNIIRNLQIRQICKPSLSRKELKIWLILIHLLLSSH